jgi:hypothetical protein
LQPLGRRVPWLHDPKRPICGRLETEEGYAMKTIVAAVLLSLAAVACTQNGPPTGNGALSVALSQAPGNGASTNLSLAQAPDPVTSVVVSVTKVRAHVESLGWIVLSDVPVQVDLLALPAAGVDLGLARLPQGKKVTQIRLLVAATGNYVVAGGVPAALTVPSGIETGIKIPGPWEIAPCNETALTLEFDGKKSVWYHPTGGVSPWILRPVIHVKRVRYEQTSCEGGGGSTCVPASCASGICDATGTCAPGGEGDGCVIGDDCLSGSCVETVCAAGGPGLPCREPTDCVSGVCGEDGSCADGGAGGAGAGCTFGTQCLSNVCNEGSCATGAEGTPCNVTPDCQTDLGLGCVKSLCQPW